MDIDNQRNIYHICYNCNYTEPTPRFKIFNKLYKKDTNKKWIRHPEFAVYDKTLPKKHTKCPSCKKINDNVFYKNENLTISLICDNCKNFWVYS